MGYQKVLVPVSGKQRLVRAARALEQALQIVREDGEICFLHCIDAVPHLITGETYRKLVQEAAGEAEKLLERLVERARNAGIAYSVHIVEGSPVARIPSFVANNACNVVVMCSDKEGESVKLAIGATAEQVFQYLSVPLLIVH